MNKRDKMNQRDKINKRDKMNKSMGELRSLKKN
jgi:hypothetical protein